MNEQELMNIKALLKRVSTCISELASSLDMFVEDEKDSRKKTLFKEQVRDAEAVAADLDTAILGISLWK